MAKNFFKFEPGVKIRILPHEPNFPNSAILKRMAELVDEQIMRDIETEDAEFELISTELHGSPKKY